MAFPDNLRDFGGQWWGWVEVSGDLRSHGLEGLVWKTGWHFRIIYETSEVGGGERVEVSGDLRSQDWKD